MKGPHSGREFDGTKLAVDAHGISLHILHLRYAQIENARNSIRVHGHQLYVSSFGPDFPCTRCVENAQYRSLIDTTS